MKAITSKKMRNKVNMVITGLGLTAVVDIIALFVLDESQAFILGSAVGIAVSLLNFFLLEYVINQIGSKGNIIVAVLVEFGRISLYFAAGYLMYIVDLYSIIGYAAGVLMLTAVLVIFRRKGMSSGEC